MTDEEQAIFNSFLRLPDIMYAGYEVQIGDKASTESFCNLQLLSGYHLPLSSYELFFFTENHAKSSKLCINKSRFAREPCIKAAFPM